MASKDTCNYDGYANSRFTIAIGSYGKNGIQTYYSEPCAALLASTPSSDAAGNQIATISVGKSDCYNKFGGTSASSPMVAGVVALILEANPSLTWRDVQAVLIHSAAPIDQSNSNWSKNTAGFSHNPSYGFGRVDASAAVKKAQEWTNLPTYQSFHSPVQNVNRAIPDFDLSNGVISSFTVSEGMTVEHVEVVFDATHPRRGDIIVDLRAPSGTVSRLAYVHGDYNPNYSAWTFTTLRNYGENSAGQWMIKVYDGTMQQKGTFNYWKLSIYGH